MRKTAVRFGALASLVAISAAAAFAASDSTKKVPTATGPGTSVRVDTDLFSGDYKDANVRDVLMDIAKVAHLNVVMPADLTGTVNAHIDKMPVMKAFELVSGLGDADYRVMDGTVSVVKRSVTIRPRVSASAPMSDADVQHAAQRIDDEDTLYRRPAQSSAPVQTTINIVNNTPSYGGYSGGYGGGYGYAYAAPYAAYAGPYAYGYPGYGYNYPITTQVTPGFSVTTLPPTTVYSPGHHHRW